MTSAQELAACLEEIARAARRHLADSADPAWRDRLSTATADAFAIIHDCPRPRRAIMVEELLAGDPVVTVGTDPSEAAAPWYNLHPHKRPGPLPDSITRNGEGIKQVVDEAIAEAPINPAELRQAVIRKLALDLDKEADPSMAEIQAEVREVRRARAQRKRQ